MEILTKIKCNNCDGAGVTTSHIWSEFFELEKQSNKAWDMEEVEVWFRERGYSKLPPEEPACMECEGTGEIQSWMDINEVLERANIIG